ncbi:MAG: hypothetical protein WBV39_04320 [Rudaea sp.]
MQAKTLILLAASALSLCATAFVVQAVPASAEATNNQANPHAAHAARWMHRLDGRGQRGANASPAVRATIFDLRAIDRLYRASGKTSALTGLYHDVLARTHNPKLRNYVYMRLARLQSAPSNPDAAIATLRHSLDENLARAEPKQDRGR